MALREIDENVQIDDCENIAELKKYRRGLAKNLKEIELRIQQRLGRLSGDASFSSDNTVNEMSLLEEDKFWKLEIQKKIQESDDELVARGLVEKMQMDIVRESTTSSPAKRDADYALQVYETERAFELATRRHLDKDEESKKLALKLKSMEDNAAKCSPSMRKK